MTLRIARLLAATSLAALAAGSPALAQDTQAVTIVVPSAPDRLDPCETPRGGVGRIIKQNVVETLVELDYGDGSVHPRLAESWEQVSPTEWNFKLRAGIAFHDGAPLDAAAVVYTIERTLDPAMTCITRTKYLDANPITATVLDPMTVRITTATPNPILPTLLAQLAIASPNTPKGDFTNEPIGTGPYRFVEWQQGTHIKLARNADYWGDEPVIDDATYVWRGETSIAAAMVETGEADLAFSIAPQDATNPETDKAYPNTETSMFRLSAGIAPLNDVRIRSAINLAIDRNAFLGSIISPEAKLAMQQVGPNVVGFNPNLQPWAYDPEKAKALVEEARADGVNVDAPIRLIGRPEMFSNATEVVEATAEMLRAIGLTVNVEMLEVAQWLEMANKPFAEDRGPNILLSMHDNNGGDASFTAFFKYHTKGRQSELSIPELDALIEKAGTLSGEERAAAYQEVFRMLREDIVADVQLFHMVNYMRVGPRLDFTPSIANAAELQLAQLKLK